MQLLSKQVRKGHSFLIKSCFYAIASLLATIYLGHAITNSAIARSHKDNMNVMCQRVREANSKGLSGIGYLEWFFSKNNIAPASAVPGFWKELKQYCHGAW